MSVVGTPVQLSLLNPKPLVDTETFSTKVKFLAWVNGPTAYPGRLVTVNNGDNTFVTYLTEGVVGNVTYREQGGGGSVDLTGLSDALDDLQNMIG